MPQTRRQRGGVAPRPRRGNADMTDVTHSSGASRKLPRHRVRSRSLTMTSVAALLSCAPALLAPAAAQEAEQVTVSASRIVRDGFQAPTPTTVVGAEDIEQQAKPNIYATIQELPS